MSKKIKHHPKIQIEDDDSFKDYLVHHHIKPISKDKKFLSKPKLSKKPIPSSTKEYSHEVFQNDEQLAPVMAEEVIAFARPDLSHKIVRRLRSGKIPIEAKLDLHGLTISKAEKELGAFLHRCELQNYRCILIIHGKGKLSPKPVLKNKLNSWLRHLSPILAFCSAKPVHGGQGAIYVLLRRHRKM